MKRIPELLACLAAAICVFTASGCGKSSPTAPEVPDPPGTGIRTPVSASVTSISVTKFPAKKADGSEWDLSVIAASKRPDLYVILTVAGRVADYVSNVVSNAETGRVYTFTESKSIYDGQLPAVLPYDNSRRTYVMDEDVGGDDDRVGWITVNLPHAYQDDNARDLDYTFSDSGNRLSVRIRGTWNY